MGRAPGTGILGPVGFSFNPPHPGPDPIEKSPIDFSGFRPTLEIAGGRKHPAVCCRGSLLGLPIILLAA